MQDKPITEDTNNIGEICILDLDIDGKRQAAIIKAVDRVCDEYGEALKGLGPE